MKAFISALIVAILLLLGFWYYMNKKCDEVKNANNLAIEQAVKAAIDSVNLHNVLDHPRVQSHVFPVQVKKEPIKTKKKTTPKKEDNILLDKRDNQKYKTVTIEGSVWMAENLNFNSENSKCYDADEKNCDELGRLYSWNEANVVCPEGWHLPNDNEWSKLINHFGGINQAGKHLKKGGNSGFNVLLAGYYDKHGHYGKVDESSYHWSATEQNDIYASFKGIYGTVDNVGTYTYNKPDGFSVRCIKD